MSFWTNLFRRPAHRPVARPRLGLERLDARDLPSVALPDPADLTPPIADPAVVAPPTTPPPLPPDGGGNPDPNAPQLAEPNPAPPTTPAPPPKAPAPAPAEPKPAEPPVVIPSSETGEGDFRKRFLDLLAKKGSTLPPDWEAHHQYIQKLEAFWDKIGVEWDKQETGLGVSPTLNKELNLLYNEWIKKYEINDPAKLTAAQIKALTAEQIKGYQEDFLVKYNKFSKAILDSVYKNFMVLPTDSPAEVDKKEKAYRDANRPDGSNTSGSAGTWVNGRLDRFKSVWDLYEKK